MGLTDHTKHNKDEEKHKEGKHKDKQKEKPEKPVGVVKPLDKLQKELTSDTASNDSLCLENSTLFKEKSDKESVNSTKQPDPISAKSWDHNQDVHQADIHKDVPATSDQNTKSDANDLVNSAFNDGSTDKNDAGLNDNGPETNDADFNDDVPGTNDAVADDVDTGGDADNSGTNHAVADDVDAGGDDDNSEDDDDLDLPLPVFA